jgi:hypothetical protein
MQIEVTCLHHRQLHVVMVVPACQVNAMIVECHGKGNVRIVQNSNVVRLV